ncbi:hypothetical protein JX265_005007 [Neoarthrinium moseri]|uniref:Uncharacterized protein n=1 Tax=Neoarthrinium moseri TaxID=1658444 RepID=A0A9Q0AQP8_9PEZI|nr:hypothetical protein JX265_005007 [Neoarthrinium moseri]
MRTCAQSSGCGFSYGFETDPQSICPQGCKTQRRPTPIPRAVCRRKTVFTGDSRVSLRQRMAEMRAKATGSPVRTSIRPVTPPPTADQPDCPPAPRKARQSQFVRGFPRAEGMDGAFCDDEDIALDRRATRLEQPPRGTQASLEPCRKLDLKPSSSPLRNSTTFEEICDMLESINVSKSSVPGGNDSEQGNPVANDIEYLRGFVDGAAVDYAPGAMAFIQKEQAEDTSKSASETMAYLMGAIDQEVGAWSSSSKLPSLEEE